MTKPAKQPQFMQSVIITFSDGETATFTGAAATLPKDTRTITNVLFSHPEPLPSDMEFVTIKPNL